MFQHIIVPVDGSDRSWVAVRAGAVIAEACAADLQLVRVVADEAQGDEARAEIVRALEDGPPLATNADVVSLVAPASTGVTIGSAIATHAESVNGAMVVMSSTGRGRSAAVLGSVADDVLRAMFGPIIVLGPRAAELESFSGDLVVPVDGSDFAETILPIAAAWGVALGAQPWVVEVITEPLPITADVFESSYANRLADRMRQQTHHDVQFEVLHSGHPGSEISAFAKGLDARLILMSTHGRTGLQRFTAGSTASAVVRSATCPVVLHRPPVFDLG
jgi:nucleotide-binding universal stress UspA family protein